ncbi:Protein of unknown function, partial [Gryllus bimaculatus]
RAVPKAFASACFWRRIAAATRRSRRAPPAAPAAPADLAALHADMHHLKALLLQQQPHFLNKENVPTNHAVTERNTNIIHQSVPELDGKVLEKIAEFEQKYLEKIYSVRNTCLLDITRLKEMLETKEGEISDLREQLRQMQELLRSQLEQQRAQPAREVRREGPPRGAQGSSAGDGQRQSTHSQRSVALAPAPTPASAPPAPTPGDPAPARGLSPPLLRVPTPRCPKRHMIDTSPATAPALHPPRTSFLPFFLPLPLTPPVPSVPPHNSAPSPPYLRQLHRYRLSPRPAPQIPIPAAAGLSARRSADPAPPPLSG